MDDRTDKLMVEWFKLVMKRNEFIREESALIYESVVLGFFGFSLHIYNSVGNLFVRVYYGKYKN